MARSIGFILEQVAKIDGILFDIILSRNLSLSQQTTDSPIEDGSIISDYTIQDPITISLRVEIGNVSFNYPDQAPISAAQDAYERLEKLYMDRTLIQYQTGFRLYKNMIITSLTQVDDIFKPKALIVDVTLKQITITASEQVKIPQATVAAGKARQQLSSELNAGRVQAKSIEEQIGQSFSI